MRFPSALSSLFRGLLAGLLAFGCSDPIAEPEADAGPESPEWVLVAEDLPGALFSVTGTSSTDVWVAGSSRGDERGPILAHWDGEEWATPETGLGAVDLLWVTVIDDELYTVGTGGTALHRGDSDFEELETPTEQDLWGVWGMRNDDVWAVGGSPSGGRGVVLRYDGTEWREVDWTLEDADLPVPSAWYKVWGRARDDVYFCGTEGALMHWGGNGFTALDSGTTRTLLTVHGRRDGSVVTAVGGQFTATLVESEEGAAFEDVTPEEQPLGMLGVFHSENEAYAVGLDSFLLRRNAEGPWQVEEPGLLLFQALHGVWIDPDGGVWAAGGQVQTAPYDLGQLIYKGAQPPVPFEE
jgi:hypothetical protein